MTGVVGDAREPLDHHRDPRQGPEVGRKPMRARALAECLIDPLEVCLVQFRLAPRAPRAPQRGGPSLAPFSIPATDTLSAHAQGTGDGRQDFSGREQARRTMATHAQGLEIPSWCDANRHAPIINESDINVTLLCETH